MPEYHGIRADRIVLMTGYVNLMDAKDKPETIPDIIEKYSSLIDEAKAIAHHVTVSSVRPRLGEVRQRWFSHLTPTCKFYVRIKNVTLWTIHQFSLLGIVPQMMDI